MIAVGSVARGGTCKEPSNNSTNYGQGLQIESDSLVHFRNGSVGSAVAGHHVRMQILFLEGDSVDFAAHLAVDPLRKSVRQTVSAVTDKTGSTLATESRIVIDANGFTMAQC